MKNSSLRVALLGGAASAFLAIGTAAAASAPADDAQPAPVAAQGADDDGSVASNDEIIVTATKRAERLQDVPASISVVKAGDLTKEGVVRFTDYAARVPGLSVTTGRAGNAQVTLRGITTGAAQPGSTTGYYIDEAPVGSVNAYTGGSGITPDLDPSDLAQIEVLKGPQGTLYGAGAVGGLLKFTTAEPDLDIVEGRASAGVTAVAKGEIGGSARGMVNVPLAPGKLALHVSGFYRLDPGYIDNVNPRIGAKDINTTRVRGGRAVLAMKLGPDVSVNLSAIGQDTTSDGNNSVDIDAATLKPISGDLKADRYVQERGYARLRLYNATVKADLGKVNLTSSTTYQRIYFRELGDATRSYASFLTANAPVLAFFAGIAVPANLGMRVDTVKHTSRWSEEARASINDVGGILDLQGGFYWTRESDINRIPRIDYFSTATGASITLPPFAVAKIDSTYEEVSFFGNARLHLGERFDILGGVRRAHDSQTYAQDYRGLLISISTGAIATGAKSATLAANGKESANITTWLVSPRYRISDDFMVYARAATGYRPGGPNPAPPTGNIPNIFDPDKLTQYEVGFKASALDRALTLDAALFYTDWSHVQIQTSGGGFNYLVNGGSARSQGGEVTLRYQPVKAFTLGFNAGYTDAKLTADAPAAGGKDGDRLPYVPRLSGSLTADYSAELGGSAMLNLGASANYVGSRTSDYSQKFPKHLDSYATFDLRAGVSSGPWSLSAFVKNLADKRAIIVTGFQGLAASATPGAYYSAAYIQPRTIGAEAAIRF
ncbi:TonB-dependent receptor [Sphingomonas sp.]|uniref:TonB-dependent receptor n=1 Tax=Sphingomonas sp. TaxID=28214 RepID=UPI001B0E8D53|nr:TonB-dependent receptor [Sphingomonas sp.]MBO9712013.1 TonB-dependent receptor [Sphingomonas sp.]